MKYINAQIEHTMLGIEDHGWLTFGLYLDYGNSLHQSFGGYALDDFIPNQEERVPTSATGKIVKGIVEAVGVTSWESLKGKYIRVAYEGEGLSKKILGIGHITKDKFFFIESVWDKV